MDVLTPEEKSGLLQALLKEGDYKDDQLAVLMRQVAVESDAAKCQHNCHVPMNVLCTSARRCGHSDKSVLQALLKVPIGRRCWERSASGVLHVTNKRSNGRLGYNQADR